MKGALFDYWQREIFLFILRKKQKKGLFQILIKKKFQVLYLYKKNVI